MSFCTGEVLIQSETVEEDLKRLVNLTHLKEHHSSSKRGLKGEQRVKKIMLLLLSVKVLVQLHKCLHMICFVALIKNVLNTGLQTLSYITFIKGLSLHNWGGVTNCILEDSYSENYILSMNVVNVEKNVVHYWKTLNTFHSKSYCSGFAKQQLPIPR